MNLDLNEKFALVTGGSHGIGLAIALELAREGCHVAICSRNPARLAKAEEMLSGMNVKTLALPADVLVPQDIEDVIDKVVSTWGTLHILVNNVGGGGRWGNPNVEETEDQVWLDVYGKNALAAARFTMRALPHMRKQLWGRVVSISSIYGKEGGGRPWFNMAKAAEMSLMKTLALNPDLVRDGITFNTVAPGSIMIPDTGWEDVKINNPNKFMQYVNDKCPLGRLGTPEEVANIVVFLCSEKAGLLNGACIAADGGESRSF